MKRSPSCVGFVAVALAALAACDRDAPASNESAVAPLAPAEPRKLQTMPTSSLTEAERKFGRAPVPDPAVVYQPEVVIVGGGAQAVRSLHVDGLGCTIDAGAPRASEIRPGGIAFVTGRCVGRVLAVERQGDRLELMLGPVEITEVIRDGSFELEQPLDFGNTLSYSAPQWPGRYVPVEPRLRLSAAPGRGERPDAGDRLYGAAWHGPASGSGFPDGWQPRPAGLHRVADKTAKEGEGPYARNNGIGATFGYARGGVVFNGHAQLNVQAPRLRFVLDIGGGIVRRCALEFHGAAGFEYAFKAGADPGGFTNASGEHDLPLDITIPVGGPVPFSVMIRQSYALDTGFNARSSYLSGRGTYTYKGSFALGYRPGNWSLDQPAGFSQQFNAASAHNGVSLGLMNVIVIHRIKLMVGIGAFGFATGPFVTVSSAFTATRSSDAQGSQFGGPTVRGLAPCNQATLSIAMRAGIGYMIPKSITNIINDILSGLNIKHRIQSSGGPQSDSKEMITWGSWSPDSDVCKLQGKKAK